MDRITTELNELREQDRRLQRQIDLMNDMLGQPPFPYRVKDTPLNDLKFAATTVLKCQRCNRVGTIFRVHPDVWRLVVRRNGPRLDNENICRDCYYQSMEEFIQAWFGGPNNKKLPELPRDIE